MCSVKAICPSAERSWPPITSTTCSNSAARTVAATSGSSGPLRSTPSTRAPTARVSGVRWREAVPDTGSFPEADAGPALIRRPGGKSADLAESPEPVAAYQGLHRLRTVAAVKQALAGGSNAHRANTRPDWMEQGSSDLELDIGGRFVPYLPKTRTNFGETGGKPGRCAEIGGRFVPYLPKTRTNFGETGGRPGRCAENGGRFVPYLPKTRTNFGGRGAAGGVGGETKGVRARWLR